MLTDLRQTCSSQKINFMMGESTENSKFYLDYLLKIPETNREKYCNPTPGNPGDARKKSSFSTTKTH